MSICRFEAPKIALRDPSDLVSAFLHRREKLALEETFKGKKVLISGSGNVAQYAAEKVLALGGKVLSLSDSTGALIANDSEGFSLEDVNAIAAVKLQRKAMTAASLADGKYTFHKGARPWTLVDSVDVALPCATQNEVSEEEAQALIKAGCRYVAEGSNMVRGCPRWQE